MMSTLTTRAYGLREYARQLSEKLSKRVDVLDVTTSDCQRDIGRLQSRIKTLEDELAQFKKVAIRPDDTDLHNINRRTDILMQRIALIESDTTQISKLQILKLLIKS